MGRLRQRLTFHVLSQGRINLRSRFLLHALEHVGIDIERKADARVTESL